MRVESEHNDPGGCAGKTLCANSGSQYIIEAYQLQPYIHGTWEVRTT